MARIRRVVEAVSPDERDPETLRRALDQVKDELSSRGGHAQEGDPAAAAEDEAARWPLLQELQLRAPMVICVLDSEFRVRWVNRANPRFFEVPYQADQIVGLPIADCLPGFRESGLEAIFLEVARTDRTYEQSEYARRSSSGSETYWRWSLSSRREPDDSTYLVLQAIEITEEVQARKAAAEAAERADFALGRLDAVLRALPIGVFLCDASGRIVLYNEGAMRIWGGICPVAESIEEYRKYRAVWAANGRPLEPNDWAMARALRNGESTKGEVVHIQRFDGTEGTVVNSALPIRDPDGRIIGGVCVVTDITDLQGARARLRENEATLRAFYDNAPFCMGVVEPCGESDLLRICDNPAASRLLGVPPGETVGKLDSALGIDLAVRSLWRDGCRRSERTGKPVDFEYRDPSGNGDRWVSVKVCPIGPDASSNPRFCYIAEDVTEKKRTQDALRRSESSLSCLYEANLVGIGVSDDRGNWLDANDELLRLTGFTREELQAGQMRWMDLTPAEYLHLDERGIAEARQRGACTPYEKEYRRRDGTLVPILIGYASVEGNPGEFIGMVLDLTELKRAEAALRDADRHKNEFLAMLAHELRNPLAAIRSAAQIIEFGASDDPELREVTEIIERQVLHLVHMVDDLLDISRISRGKFVLKKQAIDFKEIVAAAVESCRALIEEREHVLELVLPGTPIMTVGDPTRLTQVVMNLLINAARYTPPRGQISLFLTREQDGLLFRVRDNGIGIPQEMLGRVFDLFSQTNRAAERTEGGLGIGLALVKRLVEAHGGLVESQSGGTGRGSEFIVRLPLAMNQEPAGPPTAATPQVMRAAGMRRVLILDDNRDSADALARFLSLHGHEVQAAYDGHSACAVAASFSPEVAVLDLGLPGMDGFEVARQLRLVPQLRGVRLVALTGLDSESDRQRAFDVGFDFHLCKPLDPLQLLHILSEQAPN
jgi:PAS domain S-box-containing protein